MIRPLTFDEFRDDPALRDGLSELLKNPTLVVALTTVKAKNETVPVPPGLSGIDVAAGFSERQTRAIFVNDLLMLSTPPDDAPAPTPPENFGTAHSIDDFDNDPTKKTS